MRFAAVRRLAIGWRLLIAVVLIALACGACVGGLYLYVWAWGVL